MGTKDVYLKMETIVDYCTVDPDSHAAAPIEYRRDCMRNLGHEDGKIPIDEVNARRLTALIYREYLDPDWLVPKPDKIVVADINEPAFTSRVPGTMIWTFPGTRLRIHVKNADVLPHSFHVHGLEYGIDSDGSFPFGTESSDGRRSDEICPGQTWTYTFDVREEMIGAWPFHDHYRDIGMAINRGLFGGIVVLPEKDCDDLPHFDLPEKLVRIALAARQPGGTVAGAELVAPMKMQPAPVSKTVGAGAAREMTMPMGGAAGMAHMAGALDLPAPIRDLVFTLDELAHAPQHHKIPKPPKPLHVPIFFHQMSGMRGAPVFESAPLNPPSMAMPGGTFTSPVFSFAAKYKYFCGIHGPSMSGTVTVQPGGPSLATVTIVDFQFIPADVTVGVGGQVQWMNNGPSLHSVVEAGGDTLPSYCFNGRSFVGNTPTILAEAGQKIRWYVFNLDLGMNWHNFHTHGMRWSFAGSTIDVRSIGPAESFVVETVAPPVLLLPPDIARHQGHGHHLPGAKECHLRADFLFHCHVEMHMMQGLAGLVRSRQTVWLTKAQADHLAATVGLPIDAGDNECPAAKLDRCANATGGRWEELSGLPGITFMHAVLLANTRQVLFWGYGPPALAGVQQSRLWDQATGLYTSPAPQPDALTPDENLWSSGHAYLSDGTIVAHGGFFFSATAPMTADTERRAFYFNPVGTAWAVAPNVNVGRFYPTTITLSDGRLLTLFGQDHGVGGGATAASLEVFTPGPGANWSAPKALPFNYFYYPWTFQLPNGDLFVAGPQRPSRRFDWTASPVVDDPTKQYSFAIGVDRGVNMDGTAVLLPLEPPSYKPRVLVAGGMPAAAQQTAEWIDLSVAAPTWSALPNMNVPRDKLNSVILPDGRIFVAGGTPYSIADGGPAELFDPEDPRAGWQIGPSMKHPRRYHSAAILLADGSVLMGGDTDGGRDGGSLPNERYLPSYFFKTRPLITSSPGSAAYGATFSVGTNNPAGIAKAVLMRPGAVTHAFNQAQRYIGCVVAGVGGSNVHAVAPPSGLLAPPGWYLLFLVDHDRIPSVGVWIHIG
jgi:FtsP/CotA-like multicopper oxidase with cupredoxin domain